MCLTINILLLLLSTIPLDIIPISSSRQYTAQNWKLYWYLLVCCCSKIVMVFVCSSSPIHPRGECVDADAHISWWRASVGLKGQYIQSLDEGCQNQTSLPYTIHVNWWDANIRNRFERRYLYCNTIVINILITKLFVLTTSRMSASAQLYAAQIDTYRIGGPILIGVGTISCLLNLMVFTKNTLRKNPCAIYFIILNLINLCFFYMSFLFSVLGAGYNSSPTNTNSFLCRLQYYVSLVLGCWQSSCLVLAAIDRTLFTSPNVRTRQRSTCRLVAVCTSSLGTFWLIANIHVWFYVTIVQIGPDSYTCYYRPGLYSIVMSFYAAILNGLLPPLLLTIFGCWTVRNIRGIRGSAVHSRTTHISTAAVQRPFAFHSKDRQLIRILLVDITAFIICKFPVATMLFYQQLTQYNEKPFDQQLIEQSVLQLTFFWYFINNGIGCFTNIAISKTYRAELKRILLACSPQ